MGGVSAFQCGNCGGQVELRAPGQTMRAACTHCGALIDLTNPDLRVLDKYNRKLKHKPLIRLGKRGYIEGIEWEVIGFMVRKVVDYPYQWEEYLLYNPFHGFRWLLNQYGHWSFTTPLIDYPETLDRKGMAVKHEGKNFRAFSAGKAKVTFVFGEFYWEVKRGETVNTRDLVNAPDMVSLEFDEAGKNWTKSVYLPAKEIKKIFGSDIKLPPQRGIAPHQPNPHRARLKAILPIYLIAMLLLIVGQFMVYPESNTLAIGARGNVFPDSVTSYLGPEQGQAIVTDEFELEGGKANVEVTVTIGNLSNSWCEVEGYLRNKETNKVYEFRIPIEYYYGYDEEGHWSEGDRRSSKVINLVPGGKYEVVAQFYPGQYPLDWELSVRRDVPIASNFLIILAIISLPVLYLGFMANSFNKKKWADSDFT